MIHLSLFSFHCCNFFCYQWVLYSAICSKQQLFFKIYNASFGAWVPVLRVTCVLNFTDQKQYVTKLNKFGWSLCLETLQKLFQALIYTKPYNYLSKIFKQTSLFQFCFVLFCYLVSKRWLFMAWVLLSIVQ